MNGYRVMAKYTHETTLLTLTNAILEHQIPNPDADLEEN